MTGKILTWRCLDLIQRGVSKVSDQKLLCCIAVVFHDAMGSCKRVPISNKQENKSAYMP